MNQTLPQIYIPPMAGVTDLVFRRLVRFVLGNLSSSVRLSTEMISSKGILYQNNPERMRLADDEKGKVIIQLFGHEPKTMAKAAQIAEKAGASGIDLNMGCPVPKIVNGKDGAALMKEPELAEAIVNEVTQAVDLPVSVKTRLGWTESSKNIKEFALRLQEAGISSITIHGRTRAQSYSGTANWADIASVNQLLEIPVFANGDINTPDKAQQALEVTGCHGIACARALIGNFYFVRQVAHKLKNGETGPEPSMLEKLQLAMQHVELAFDDKGEKGIQAIKRHMSKYVAGIKGAALWRQKLATSTNYRQMKTTLQEVIDFSTA